MKVLLRAVAHLTLFWMCVALCGCGGGSKELPDLAEVTGVVTLDGKPLEGATVTFEPEGTRPSTGETDAEGRYALNYKRDVPGAALGSHTVRISKYESPELPEETLPRTYNEESTLTAEVKTGKNEFSFKLESKPAPVAGAPSP